MFTGVSVILFRYDNIVTYWEIYEFLVHKFDCANKYCKNGIYLSTYLQKNIYCCSLSNLIIREKDTTEGIGVSHYERFKIELRNECERRVLSSGYISDHRQARLERNQV